MASFKAAALTSLLASAGLVSAQGFFYQEPFGCSADQDIRYLGCAAVTKQPFGYNPTNPDGDYSRGYPGYAASGHVNSTITPAGCTKACRGHGFKYAALYERGCRCGTSIDGLSPSTTDESACANNDPCRGDGRENCGSTGGARIYVDPSFQDYSLVTDKVANYGVMGCFYQPNLPTGDTDISQTTVDTAAQCLTFCAASYYPFAYMAQNGASSKGYDHVLQNCCHGMFFLLTRIAQYQLQMWPGLWPQSALIRRYNGSILQTKMFRCARHQVSIILCSILRLRINLSFRGCTGQDCCGNDGEQIYPVYANPDYMGCNLPRIPGLAPRAVATPADNQYTCITTPQSILARATHTIAYAGKPKITRSASFVATATAGARTYINFGCYPDADRSAPISGGAPVLAANLPDQKVSVSNCIAACAAQNPPKDWVALRGAVGGAQTGAACICGTTKGNLGNSNDMEICKLPCDGADNTENCGPDNGVLVYAISASATTGDWYTSYTSTYSVTHSYSCTPTDSSSSASATTSSEAVSTTSSEAVSTTSSEA
ncbi:hypothetical protein PG985_012558, partial [Apiospora marii]|uniref:uncharacterized protein n=1 Tax=Apiospora marii TaxID=335849 RepID=UPI00312F3284